jgi:hypothetical protein
MLIDEIISINPIDVNKRIISDYYVGKKIFQDFPKMEDVMIQNLAFTALFSILNTQLGFSIIK